MEKDLAIVIPAYKARFFKEVLDSIAQQDNPNFAVYVGDDASPDDLMSIVALFQEKMDIHYVRFQENMGSHNLVAHWERCIRLSHEPLIWLFSDDDLMPSDAVDRVLKAAEQYGHDYFFSRFPLSVIDEHGKITFSNPLFASDKVSGYEFLLDKLSGKISSAACEYVFSRQVWQQSGGFVQFPLAWCSDDATWASFADEASGIISLPGKPVCWRNAEGTNISNSCKYDRQKLEATGLFLQWIASHYSDKMKDSSLHRALEKYLRIILKISVRRNYQWNDLIHLCIILARFSPWAAIRLFCSCK